MATPRKTAAKKTATRAAEDPVIADVTSWKKPPAPVQLPSGNWVMIRRAGMRAFLASGLIPNALMAVVQQALESGKEPDEKKLMEEVMGNPEKLAEFMGMLDAAAVYSMVQPRVYPAPASEEDRREDLLYVDELDEADKMAIFQMSTEGVIDLEGFRS